MEGVVVDRAAEVEDQEEAQPVVRRARYLLSRSLKLSPSESHIFKTVSQELCPSDGTSQRTSAVPAKEPGAARLSLSDQEEAQPVVRRARYL